MAQSLKPKMECLKLKICTNQQLMKFLCDKVLNVDLKSIVLEKSLEKLEEDDLLHINVQLSNLTYVLECKLIDKNIVVAEPFNFGSLIPDLDALDYTNLIPTIQTISNETAAASNEKGNGKEEAMKRLSQATLDSISCSSIASSSTGTAYEGDCIIHPHHFENSNGDDSKLDKLLMQNEKILEYLAVLEKKQDKILKQNEQIMEHQMKKQHTFSAHCSVSSNPDSTNSNLLPPTQQFHRQQHIITEFSSASSNRPTSTVPLIRTSSSTEFQPHYQQQAPLKSVQNSAAAAVSNIVTQHEFELGSTVCSNTYDYFDSNQSTTANTTQNTSLSNYTDTTAEDDVEEDLNSDFDFPMLADSSATNVSALTAVETAKSSKKKKNAKGTELTQKEFNRKMRACMMQHIPQEDLNLGMMDLCEKYPEKVNVIKSHLKSFLPKGSTFNTAWSKALHSIRQHKYMEKKKK